MDSIDASHHSTEREIDKPPASLLNVIIDTNPHAWAYLAPTLPLSRAVAALLVFLDAHLALSNKNEISVIASHVGCAEQLYPPSPSSAVAQTTTANGEDPEPHDTPMANMPRTVGTREKPASFYRPFASLTTILTESLVRLISTTPASALTLPPTTHLAGALTLALSHTHKTSMALAPSSVGGVASIGGNDDASLANAGKLAPGLSSRILVLSTTPASAAQYIPLMNTIFAAQRLRIPINVLALNPTASATGQSVTNGIDGSGAVTMEADEASPFLQQAATTTGGIYLTLRQPHGLLQTLLQAYLPSPPARETLVPPARPGVDFRAACFCHRRVVDIGYVCSVCLSIFCEPPEDATCLTCGTYLKLGQYGHSPIVVARKRKKRRREEGNNTPGGGTPSAATPAR